MASFLKRKYLFLLGFVVLCSAVLCQGDPMVCSAVYKFGGASALLHSPECSHWMLPDHGSSSPTFCHTATLQGRQKHQEDRVLCALDLYMPLPSKNGTGEVKVGVTAVFDGHDGAEASNLISKIFLDYLSVNVQYLARIKQSTSSVDDSFHLEALKEGLVRSIDDLGVIFTSEAKARGLVSGTTASISLLVDGQILVANVGDSKTFLCSKKALSPSEAAKESSFFRRHLQKRPMRILVKELTRDHHPDREDERARIEAYGGYIVDSRVDGQLAISRSIGALPHASHGVISTPEVTDWQKLAADDRYLVAASDGVFEKMSLEDACELLSDEGASMSPETSMADRLVNTAFEKGSTDNLAAVVVPIRSSRPPSGPQEEEEEEEEEEACRVISRTGEL